MPPARRSSIAPRRQCHGPLREQGDAELEAELEAERRRLSERERFVAAREAALSSARPSSRRSGGRRCDGPDRRRRTRQRRSPSRSASSCCARRGSRPTHDIREDKLDKREAAVAEREEKLRRREGDLGAYVAQVQDDFDRRDAEWWAKQLGDKPLQAAS